MRLFEPAGNPYARNICKVISRMQQRGSTQLEMKTVR